MFVDSMEGLPKKVLMIRFSSIGDIVLTTPVIRAVKNQWQADIHFLTKEGFAPIVEANPHVSRVFTLRKKVSEVSTILKKEQYDLVIDLHHNIRTLLVKMALRKPSVTFRKLNKEKYLLTKFKINRLPDLHIVDRYLESLKPFGLTKDDQGLDFFIPSGKEMDETTFWNHFPEKYKRQPLLVIVVGAAHTTKQIPSDLLIDVCHRWVGPVALIGGPSEVPISHSIAKATGDYVQDFCGRTTLFESAGILLMASLVLTPDTGMMHIAAAFDKPMVSVWGSTVPEFGMYPYRVSQHQLLEVKDLACRPCSKIGYDQCPKGHFKCMTQSNVVDVIASM